MSTTLTKAWLSVLEEINNHGINVAPRGEETLEIPQATICVDTRHPILLSKSRRLSYRFMAAEAYWILTGSDRVDEIAPYNKNIAQFSDDGIRFFGAYGPKIQDQFGYVVTKLHEDHDTRQAGLTIWRENPPRTKDVPCTITVFFQRRGNRLNAHVFMRSSDVWLGLPYDVFNFSMLTHLVCADLNRLEKPTTLNEATQPGDLYLTAASSHLYTRDRYGMYQCLEEAVTGEILYAEASSHDYKRFTTPTLEVEDVPTPAVLFLEKGVLMSYLDRLRDTAPGHHLRWWELQTKAHKVEDHEK